jgi:hypothetical protein
MDSTSEKYPVCPDRNTPAAFRWFYQPLSVLAFLKGRPTRLPAAAVLLPARHAPERMRDRG